MTAIEIAFRYGQEPGLNETRAVDTLREVYGIRRIRIDEKERTLRVEYDATRLSETTVTSLLRRAGIDLQEKMILA